MNSIDFFDGERELERTNWGESHDDVQVNCTTVARWILLKSRAVECGNEKEISLKREIGIQTTQKEDFEAALKAGLEVKGFAKFAAELKSKTGFEFKKEERYTEEEKFKIVAPQCGQKKLMIYQLIKEHRFEITDNRFFSFNKGKQYIPIVEYTDHIWDRSPTAQNIPECNCDEKDNEPEGLLELGIRNLSLVTAFHQHGDGVLFENLDLTLSHDELGRLLIGKYETKANNLPNYLRFIAGFKEDEVLPFSLRKIIRLKEQYSVTVEMVNIGKPMYGRVLRGGIDPRVFESGVEVRVLGPRRFKEDDDDDLQFNPGRLYRGFGDDD